MNTNQLTNRIDNHSDTISIDTPAISIKGIDRSYTDTIINIAALPVVAAAFCALLIVVVPLAPAIIAANKLMDKYYE